MKDAVRIDEGKQDVTRCPYCHEACAAAEATACPSCEAPHHAECWTAGGGCSACAIGVGRPSERGGPIGTPVPTGAPRPAPQRPPLTLDLVRETLVRAGYGLAEVDHALGARRVSVVGGTGGLRVLLSVVALLAAGLATFLWVDLAMSSHSPREQAAVAATATVVALLSFALALLRR